MNQSAILATQTNRSGFIFRDLLLGLCAPVLGIAAMIFFSANLLLQIGDSAEQFHYSAGSSPLGLTNQPVPNSITDLQLSFDSHSLISTQQDGLLRIYDAYTGEVLHRFQEQNQKALCVSISPDGLTAAAGFMKGKLLVWKQIDGRWNETELNYNSEDLHKLRFSADGQVLAAGYADGHVSFLNVKNLKQFACPLIDESGMKCLQLSPDSRTAIIGGSKGNVTLWEIKQNQEIACLKTGDQLILDLAFSPTKNLVAVTSVSGVVSVWDLSTHQKLWEARPDIYISFALDFSSDGKTLATGGSEGDLVLYDVSLGKQVRSIKAHSRVICKLQFSNDGQSLVSGSMDGTIRTWELIQFQEVMLIE